MAARKVYLHIGSNPGVWVKPRRRSCFRRPAQTAEIEGAIPGAERFVDAAIYDRWIPSILEKIRREGPQAAELQAIDFGELVLVGLPGEVFARLVLEIKAGIHPRHPVVVGAANGMVGYVPYREAFARGGYEVSFGPSSWLGPRAGEMLRHVAIRWAPDAPGGAPEIAGRFALSRGRPGDPVARGVVEVVRGRDYLNVAPGLQWAITTDGVDNREWGLVVS